MHGDVGVGAHHHAEMAKEGFHPTDGFGRLQPTKQGRHIFIAFLDDRYDRARQEIHQVARHAHRPRAGTTAAVRGGEGLVQVEVHDINAQIAGASNAQQRVHIGAVAINQPTGFMDEFDHFEDVLVKQTQGVGIGDHDAGDGIIAQAAQHIRDPRCRSRRWAH